MSMKTHRGFTIFFAVLVSSLALSVGFAIYDLVTRELVLSQTTTQSQYAIFAADTGAECALYWDTKFPGTNFSSIFVAPPTPVGLDAGEATCGGQDIYKDGTPPNPYATSFTSWTDWVQASSTSGSPTVTTTFTLGLASSSCAVVEVIKTGNPAQTTITSRGYNSCARTGNPRVERLLQVTY